MKLKEVIQMMKMYAACPVCGTTDYWAGLVADALIGQGVIPAPRGYEKTRALSGYVDKLREIKEDV